ncbi:MAG: DEAD/DEAH box helicase [Geobacteraceae bacterium]|nr:DEAD/DEAH box helicase [Geobacteraceae bacterium]
MLVYPNKRALVVRPRDPIALQTLIPTAKRLQVNGKEFLAIPHKLDETRVLRNLGMNPPSPIRYHYKWSGQYTPFKAQMETAEFLTLNPRAYVLNEMGTGKTLAALWAYDYLRSLGHVHKMLVICPLSTMERTWADEIFRHFPHLDFRVIYGDRKRRLKLLEQEADIYIVNHDGLSIIAADLAKRPDIDIIVPDEIAQAARNASTDRWKLINAVVNKQQDGTRWCWGVTGTPTPNAPTDAWAQCRIVTPSTVPPYFNKFKDLVMRQVNQFLWMPRPDATEKVFEVMQPSIRFSRAECMDLPPCVFQTRHVDLTKEQRDAYKDMFTKLKFEAANGEVLAVNEAVKASKLVQIACGAAYDSNKSTVQLDATPRLTVVKEIVDEAEGKVIIFVPFVSAIETVSAAVSLHLDGVVNAVAQRLAGDSSPSVGCIHGQVTKAERDRIFKEFQKGSQMRVIVAQPAAMSHGLTLTAANTIIWYAPIFSNDIYDQACARITRPGQTKAQLIVNIEGSPIELKAYERLRNKQKMQGLLLSMVEDERVSTAS